MTAAYPTIVDCAEAALTKLDALLMKLQSFLARMQAFPATPSLAHTMPTEKLRTAFPFPRQPRKAAIARFEARITSTPVTATAPACKCPAMSQAAAPSPLQALDIDTGVMPSNLVKPSEEASLPFSAFFEHLLMLAMDS
jgi:hypothetical protein